jgi:hypothetical protein
LLAMIPRVDPMAARESFRRSLVAYLEQVAGGNVLALARIFGVHIAFCRTGWTARRFLGSITCCELAGSRIFPLRVFSLHRGRHR